MCVCATEIKWQIINHPRKVFIFGPRKIFNRINFLSVADGLTEKWSIGITEHVLFVLTNIE